MARSHADVYSMQKSRLPSIYSSPFTRSKGIVWRAAPNEFLGERWVRIKISRIFIVNGVRKYIAAGLTVPIWTPVGTG
jgi:hypothetical protein